MRQGTLNIVALVQPGEEGVNLDDQWPEDLAEFAEDVNESAEAVALLIFPSMPEGYVRATEALGNYAALKSQAMEKRAAGDIAAASELETTCNLRYRILPAFARW